MKLTRTRFSQLMIFVSGPGPPSEDDPGARADEEG